MERRDHRSRLATSSTGTAICSDAASARAVQFQVDGLRLALADGDGRGLRLDAVEEFGIGPLALLDLIERHDVVAARRQRRDLESAVLVGTRAPDVPRVAERPFLAVLGKGDRKSTRLNSSHIPLSRMPS